MKVTFLIILLLLLPIALAEETLIYDDYFQAGGTKSINGRNISVHFNRDTNITIIEYPGAVDVIPQDMDCSTEWIYKACIAEKKYYKGAKEVPATIHGRVNVSLKLKIYELTQAPVITKTALQKEFQIGEKERVTITLDNPGKFPVSEIYEEDRYDKGFMLQAIDGCNVVNHSIVWKGELEGNQKHSCVFDLTAIRATVLNNLLFTNYSFYGKSSSESIEQEIKVISDPLALLAPPVSAPPNTTFNMTFTLVPETEVRVDTLLVLVPDAFTIHNLSDKLISSGKYLKWEGSLNEEETFWIELSTPIINEFQVPISLDFTAGTIRNDLQQSQTITIHQERPVLNLSRNRSVLLITNPTDTTFSKITLTWDHEEHSIRELGPGVTYNVSYNSSTKNIEVSYQSQFGQYLSFTHTWPEEDKKEVLNRTTKPSKEEPVQAVVVEGKDKARPLSSLSVIPRKIAIYLFIGAGLILVIFLVIFLSGKSSKDNELKEDIKRLEKELK